MATLMSSNGSRFWLRCAAGAALTLALAGCGRNEIKVYKLEKESPSRPAGGSAAAAPAPGVPGADAKLSWGSLPDGWKEVPASGMRVASFSVTGPAGRTADVSVIPLPAGEPELDLVNMWRQQLQLAPVSAEGPDSEPEPVSVGSVSGKLFDMASAEPVIDGKSRARFLVAMATRGSTSWFFKMTGEDSFVRQQKAAFERFLKSVSIPANGEPVAFTGGAGGAHQFLSTNAKETPSADAEKPVWVVPPGWREVPATQFLLAKFEIAGPDGSQAEASVSMLDGAGGGVLANVNRWRGQIGLAPVDDAALATLVTSVDTEGGKAIFVDMNGTDAQSGRPTRLVAAIVPQNGQTWFYKLMGDEKAVGPQKDVFVTFVKTVQYRHAL